MHLVSRRRLGAAVLAVAALLAGAARADATDDAYAANPVLGRIARRDPAKARKLLDDNDAALARPASRALAPLAGNDRALLEENPLLGKLYIHDASAALLLLRRVKEAAGGGKP